MAIQTPPKDATAADDPKLYLFEDDDEFEEFENEEWDDEGEGKDALQQWEDDWDDDDISHSSCERSSQNDLIATSMLALFFDGRIEFIE
ncbi:hypothetical protein GOP47_0020759 [Adiantum capillus-veneris]|uniref:26S proteasome complex subunit SEM1 n=1 Tax=Adiantum capillus-veneris TaxID=13818 RepID=A0A9D4Z7A0_ADICA|nr:hypothetical protein GOP47_0020759 [Adiantum capillus-veneris]